MAVCIICSSCMVAPDGPLRLGRDLGNDEFLRRGSHFGIQIVESDPYRHYVFEKLGCRPVVGEPLFVFLDGDGNSWIRDGFVSKDPTPPDPLALDLLGLDHACGIYVSRPCTFGLLDQDDACEPRVWTLDRYSPDMISSLAGVIDRIVPAGQPIVLVGYSGGGLLASYLAGQRKDVVGVITLGANLALSAWASHHGYLPEVASAAPPSPFPLANEIAELHVFAGRDAVTPSTVTLEALDSQTRSAAVILEEADHTCCWLDEWPGIRELFQQRIESSTRSRSSSSAR